MALIPTGNQYKYTGKGPLDKKSLVSTFDDLLVGEPWGNYAYNGMVVGVGLDKDPEKNGVYYLYDPTVTSARGIPDYTVAENWHKLGTAEELSVLADRLSALEQGGVGGGVSQETLDEAIADAKTIRVSTIFELPNVGTVDTFYKCDDGITYTWNGTNYQKFAIHEIN